VAEGGGGSVSMSETARKLEHAVRAVLARGDGVEVASPPREIYLTMAENVTRQASAWQCEHGMIGDPHNVPGVESVTATARYCAAVGRLLAVGRCEDLLESGARAMEWCLAQLARSLEAGESWPCANFNLKDMMVLYAAAPGRVSAERLAAWREQLSWWEPEQVYHGHVNWWFYATAAEAMRIEHGLSRRVDWIDATLEGEMGQWTAHGMYRDPGDPVTYDLTVRQCLVMMLEHGYAGRFARWARETLRTGALATLLMVSPTGIVPFGGRSAQYHMQEAMLAYLAEWQARQEAARGDLRLAGALRRMALAGAQAASRWLLREPYAVTKNLMADEPFFGQDGFGAGQNAHSGYGLLAANLFAGAWYLADGAIEPRPMPADLGGYALHLPDAFFRVFATAGGYHIEIDTRGQPGYDATGLGRIHRAGVPVELALNMPIDPQPKYRMPLTPAARRVALGPGWPVGEGRRWLAEASRDDDYEVRVTADERADAVTVEVEYSGDIGAPQALVRESCHLSRDGLRYETHVPGAQRVRLQVPAIETDGEATSAIEVDESGLRVTYRGHAYEVRLDRPATRAFVEDRRAPNRNGVYRVAVFEAEGDRVGCGIELR